jgi:uncharacterized membrane protein YkoI
MATRVAAISHVFMFWFPQKSDMSHCRLTPPLLLSPHDNLLREPVSVLSFLNSNDVSMKRYMYLLLLFASLAPPLSPARADDDDDHRQRESLNAAVKNGEIMQLSDILKKVRSQIKGRILEIEFEDSKQNPIYEMYILDSGGRRLEYEVDARTGKILNLQGDN